ncbi:MAG: hypothetical protein OEM26_13595 [Saprospiraceae bacterium]|nr:hypothetical protein [Saprospiraceae bacterium]
MTTFQYWMTVLLSGTTVLTLSSCDKWDFDRTSFTQVITVGALEVGFNSAFLLGDIEGLKNANVIETGFAYSSTADSEQSLQLDQEGVEVVMSPRHQDSIITAERAFAARATGLAAATKYFFRAFITLDGSEIAYGTIDTLTTIDLTLSTPEVERTSEDCVGSVTITVNLSGAVSTPDNSFGIIWSTVEGNFDPLLGLATRLEVETIDAQGNLIVELPVECSNIYSVRGFYMSRESEIYGPVQAFTTSEGGAWIPVNTFPEPLHLDMCFYSFSNDEFGFVLTFDRVQAENQLWRFDPQELTWQTAAKPPFVTFCTRRPARTVETVFIDDDNSFDRWQYEMGVDVWFNWSTTPVVDGISYLNDYNFLHDDTDYWGTGRSELSVHDDAWWRPITSSTINAMPNFPGGARHKTTYFVLKGSGYVGLGQDLEGHFFEDFWKLDFTAMSWSPVASLNDQIRPALDFTMDDKAYLLTGYDANDKPLSNFYEYDSTLDLWTRLADFGDGDGTADVGFAIDDVIYGGLGMSTNGERSREIWRYVPEVN